MSRKNEVTTMVDLAVARKIEQLRTDMGLSRAQLGSKIGVTHQQAAKYLVGTNRISAGRLVLIADALKKPVSYFFEGLEEVKELPTHNNRMRLEVNRNFEKLKPAVQISINNHIRTLAQNS